MKETEREIIGFNLLKDCQPKDVVDYFGWLKIVKQIEDDKLVDYLAAESYIETDIPQSINCENCTHCYRCLDNYEEDEDDAMFVALYNICKAICPTGYIGKNEMKRLISDYIDTYYKPIIGTI